MGCPRWAGTRTRRVDGDERARTRPSDGFLQERAFAPRRSDSKWGAYRTRLASRTGRLSSGYRQLPCRKLCSVRCIIAAKFDLKYSHHPAIGPLQVLHTALASDAATVNSRLKRTHQPANSQCQAAGYVLRLFTTRPSYVCGTTVLTQTPGEGGRLPHAAIAGADEEQVEGRPDRPRPAQEEERGPHQVCCSQSMSISIVQRSTDPHCPGVSEV